MANNPTINKSLIRPTPPPSAETVASWQAQMRQAMFEALDADAVREIMAGLIEKAKKGDLAAARLILNYAVGGATVNVRNAVIVEGHAAPLPAPPSRGLPGSSLRIGDMAARADRGLPVFDPRDVTREDKD